MSTRTMHRATGPATAPASGRVQPAGALVAGALSGLLLWAASPAVGAAALAWVAIVPAAAVALAGEPRTARLAVPFAYAIYLELLLVPALPFGLAEGQFAEPPVPVLVEGSPVLLVALLAIPLLGLALYAFRFGTDWGARRLPGPAGAAGAILVPALAWPYLDFARVNLDPGGTWGPLFQSQAGTTAGDLAAIGGPWLVTLAIVLVNYGGAAALARRSPRLLAITALILAAALGGGALGASRPEGGRALRVAAVQPGYDTAAEGRPELRRFEPGSYRGAALDLVEALSAPTRAAARRGARLVVWPEAVMFVDPREHPPVLRVLGRLARESNVAIVVGWFDADATRSAAAVVGADGRLSPARPKQRPMWFIGESAHPAPAAPITVGGLRVGTLPGLDVGDPQLPATLADRGAQLIASATHDWRQLATQQRASSKVAASASGLPLVRADWRHGSAVYDAGGDLVADAGLEQREALLVADVPLGEPTPYARAGDVLAWAAVALTILAGGAALTRSPWRRAARVRARA